MKAKLSPKLRIRKRGKHWQVKRYSVVMASCSQWTDAKRIALELAAAFAKRASL